LVLLLKATSFKRKINVKKTKKVGKVHLSLDSRKVNAWAKKDHILCRRSMVIYHDSSRQCLYQVWIWKKPIGRCPWTKFRVIRRLSLFTINIHNYSLHILFTIPGKPLWRHLGWPILHKLWREYKAYSSRSEEEDDLLVVSSSFETYLRMLGLVAEQVKKAGLTPNVL